MRNLLLSLSLIMCLGCGLTKPKEIVIDGPAHLDYTPLLFINAQFATPDPAPPKPTIKVGDSCPSCGGDGIMGDGVTKTACRDCNGDGRVDLGDEILGRIASTQEEFTILPSVTYFVGYKGREYVWDGSKFVSEDGLTITPQRPLDVEKEAQISICQGQFCQYIKILRR